MLKKLLAIIIIFTFTLGGLLFPSVSLEGVELFNSTTAQAAHELQGKYFTMTWNQPVYDSSFNTALLYTGEKTTIGNFNAYWTNCSSGAVLPENGTGFEVLMVGWQIGISSSGNGVLNGSYSATLYRGVTDRGWSYVYSTATTAAGVAASNSYWWQWTIGDPTLDYISGREYPANYEIKWGSGTFTNPYVLQQLTAVTPEPSPTVGTPGNISYSSLQWGSTLTAPSNPTGGTRTRWEYATSSTGTWYTTGVSTQSYLTSDADIGYYFRVRYDANTGYIGGPVYSNTVRVTAKSLSSPGSAPSGSTIPGYKLTAPEITGATYTLQWYRGSSTPITNATESTYTLTASDIGYQIRVQYTGTGNYTGTVNSSYTSTVSQIPVGESSSYTPVLPSTTTTVGDFPEA